MPQEYVILRHELRLGTAEPFKFPRFDLNATVLDSTPHPSRLGNVFSTLAESAFSLETGSLNHSQLQDVSKDPLTAIIAPNMPISLVKPFDATSGSKKVDSTAIAATGADTSNFSGEGVVVAILDTGIDTKHPAFKGVSIIEKDFTGSGNGDRHGHGTHCAGTVFGRDVEGKRIGVARGIKSALIGKVLNDLGESDTKRVFEGILWAVLQGAQVVSMSLGFDFPGYVKRLQEEGWPTDLATSLALEAYRANVHAFDSLMQLIKFHATFTPPGAVIIAAAGNESQRQLKPEYKIGASLPACAEGIIAVGALEPSSKGFRVAKFSNTFPQITAPGINIESAKAGGGLCVKSGTSMACPHVAGVAALWWQAMRESSNQHTPAIVIAKLLASARADVFAAEVDKADRGQGLVTAPQK